MKEMEVKVKILDRNAIFKSFQEDNKIQIQLILPEVLQTNIAFWRLEPKWFFIVDTKINSCHDKNKIFTKAIFLKFVNKLMSRIKRSNKIARIIVSEETSLNSLLGRHYSLDYILGNEVFRSLRDYNFLKKYSRFGWESELKNGIKSIPFFLI